MAGREGGNRVKLSGPPWDYVTTGVRSLRSGWCFRVLTLQCYCLLIIRSRPWHLVGRLDAWDFPLENPP
jgi:hypothetical protein